MAKLNTSSALISFRIPLAQYHELERMRGDVPLAILIKYGVVVGLETRLFETEIYELNNEQNGRESLKADEEAQTTRRTEPAHHHHNNDIHDLQQRTNIR